jgi:hypothetical protein
MTGPTVDERLCRETSAESSFDRRAVARTIRSVTNRCRLAVEAAIEASLAARVSWMSSYDLAGGSALRRGLDRARFMLERFVLRGVDSLSSVVAMSSV